MDKGHKNEIIALGVGYGFCLVTRDEIKHISYVETNLKVKVGDTEYILHRGSTFADSRKIDDLLDNGTRKEYGVYERQI